MNTKLVNALKSMYPIDGDCELCGQRVDECGDVPTWFGTDRTNVNGMPEAHEAFAHPGCWEFEMEDDR